MYLPATGIQRKHLFFVLFLINSLVSAGLHPFSTPWLHLSARIWETQNLAVLLSTSRKCCCSLLSMPPQTAGPAKRTWCRIQNLLPFHAKLSPASSPAPPLIASALYLAETSSCGTVRPLGSWVLLTVSFSAGKGPHNVPPPALFSSR